MTRATLALFWLVAGAMHFVAPGPYRAIVPRRLAQWRGPLVAASGVAEIAGGLAVVPARTRPLARWWLLGTLAAVFPANVEMALRAERYKRVPSALLWARLPLQALFALHVWRGTRS